MVNVIGRWGAGDMNFGLFFFDIVGILIFIIYFVGIWEGLMRYNV